MAKSQSGVNAAILIGIISALIIIYIIFLPSDQRLNLIGENDTDGDNESTLGELLLDEREIGMSYTSKDEIGHPLSAVNLYTATESSKIKEVNSVYVKNGMFDKEDAKVEFSVNDPDSIKNVLLSFDAKRSNGVLSIKLNNHEIFNNGIDKVNIDPIKISNDLIAKTNEMQISVSGVGIAFWKTNEYMLENFQIIGDVTDKSTNEASMSFIVPRSEAEMIEQSKLRFNPECQPSNSGILEIFINNQMVYSSVPDCGTLIPQEFASGIILTGENKIKFRAEKGRYLIDQINIVNKLRETPSYTYYFQLDSDQLKDIQNGRKKANLTFYFADDSSDKEAEIIINNAKTYMSVHDEFQWNTNIDRFLDDGSNSIKIVPKKDMDIRKLQIRLTKP